MKGEKTRWSLPHLESAVDRVKERNRQRIRCILSPHGEFSMSEEKGQEAMGTLEEAIDAVAENGLRSSVAIKPSTIGAAFDGELCKENIRRLCKRGRERRVILEMDMETKPLVPLTMDLAKDASNYDCSMVVALQSYLDQTPSDLKEAKRNGLKVRLVKGAYGGDTDDEEEIRLRLRSLAEILLATRSSFNLGTHDPELVDPLREKAKNEKGLLEFGFLRGLAEDTKLIMAEKGWRVSEYIPYGPGGSGYEDRRENYLKRLQRIGREPLP
ncbi:MAG: proline dehydrogenase family protein [Methanomassiliicoccales archaeon]